MKVSGILGIVLAVLGGFFGLVRWSLFTFLLRDETLRMFGSFVSLLEVVCFSLALILLGVGLFIGATKT